jgi:hypothetical protein
MKNNKISQIILLPILILFGYKGNNRYFNTNNFTALDKK